MEEYHPLEIQATRLTCELTIVPPASFPDIDGQFEPMTATLILLKQVGYPWVLDSVKFQGRYFSMKDGEKLYTLTPCRIVRADIHPVFIADSARWAIQYASNRWEEAVTDDQ